MPSVVAKSCFSLLLAALPPHQTFSKYPSQLSDCATSPRRPPWCLGPFQATPSQHTPINPSPPLNHKLQEARGWACVLTITAPVPSPEPDTQETLTVHSPHRHMAAAGGTSDKIHVCITSVLRGSWAGSTPSGLPRSHAECPHVSKEGGCSHRVFSGSVFAQVVSRHHRVNDINIRLFVLPIFLRLRPWGRGAGGSQA